VSTVTPDRESSAVRESFHVAHWNARGPIALLLAPLAWLHAGVLALRRAAYRTGLLATHRLPVPVVVVGNFVVGGTGKTPFTIALAQALASAGRRPGIVSRGYGGTEHGPAAVRPGADPARFGDEPVLMAAAAGCPVFIGRARADAARALLAAHPEVDVILCDDGLQHLALARDVEIAIFDARGAGNGLLLPAGPLRECPRAVDAVVRNGGGAAPGERAMHVVFDGCRRLADDAPVAIDALRGRRLHAAAGIGSPARFFAMLASLGLDCVPHAFPDHHRFTVADLAFPDADHVLITAKDAVKCASFPPGAVRDRIVVVAVKVAPDPALLQLVTDRIRGLPPA
jgi:tetraacyldisaccharide 4'-kinase